mmetsp:Transcript_34519/g.66651  ORF Transcript_34519/g.66651 Transcript_34519/m.66651 type:complete len:146 (-) Transcript_34519:116-553(-)
MSADLELTLDGKWCRAVSNASTCVPREAEWQRDVSSTSNASISTGISVTATTGDFVANHAKEGSSTVHGGTLALVACVALVIGALVAWIFLPTAISAGLSAILLLNVASSAVMSSSRQHAVIVGVWLPLCAFSAATYLAPLAPPL